MPHSVKDEVNVKMTLLVCAWEGGRRGGGEGVKCLTLLVLSFPLSRSTTRQVANRETSLPVGDRLAVSEYHVTGTQARADESSLILMIPVLKLM